jgi:hypothetical protein
MDSQLSVYVFEWNGVLRLHVDRVHRRDGRKYAPRTRLAEASIQVLPQLRLVEATEWGIDALDRWLAAGLPPRWEAVATATPAPLGRGHGVRRVAPGESAAKPLPSKTQPLPGMTSASEASSDGLLPEGHTIPLF